MSTSPLPLEMDATEVKRRMAAGEPLLLIDVREPEEHRICRIEGSRLIPMGSVPAALSELEGQADKSPLVVFCHHGMRSLNVVNWLRGQGLERCTSMAGGIDRWSTAVDPAVPRY